MKIALINENSQKKKNSLILGVLNKVAQKYGHEIYNYGASEDKEANIDYVGAGLLTGILLNTKTVDFVITGCASGCGVMMVANTLPEVECGYVADAIDASLFARVNAGNAISIPFGKYFGTGAELNLENIFETLFSTTPAIGYPKERVEIQENQRNAYKELKSLSTKDMYTILDNIDKDLLKGIVKNDYFEEFFFANSLDDVIGEYLKEFIDGLDS
ncbi:MAG: RpiB/LacA/LacB family sugar-phosphate isomerase [Bacilli bacterium]|nr:RpiB/LacA/LacB family sugar-phosphate isomerase [Bacilli bacterium]